MKYNYLSNAGLVVLFIYVLQFQVKIQLITENYNK